MANNVKNALRYMLANELAGSLRDQKKGIRKTENCCNLVAPGNVSIYAGRMWLMRGCLANDARIRIDYALRYSGGGRGREITSCN
jgi:hypothetical protein